MKNKKLTYFLLVVVAAVWGIIIYRILNAAQATDEPDIPAAVRPVKEEYNDFSLPKDTARLLLNYRDPFGLTVVKDTTKTTIRTGPVKPAATAVKPTVNWSFISYAGYIRNPATKRLVALVSINGQNVTLAEGETRSQVKLLKNLRDSIKIVYAGKIKFITIKSASL